MKSINIIVLYILIMIAISGTFSCNEDEEEILPSLAKNDIENLISDWNLRFGSDVKIENWQLLYMIDSETKKTDAITEMINPEYIWIPEGIFELGQNVSAINIASIPDSEMSCMIDNYQSFLESTVSINNYLIKLNWSQNNEPFSTLSFTNNDSLLYDPLISNLWLAEYVVDTNSNNYKYTDTKNIKAINIDMQNILDCECTIYLAYTITIDCHPGDPDDYITNATHTVSADIGGDDKSLFELRHFEKLEWNYSEAQLTYCWAWIYKGKWYEYCNLQFAEDPINIQIAVTGTLGTYNSCPQKVETHKCAKSSIIN